MQPEKQILYRIALKKIPKVGAVTARNLVSHCGSVEAIFQERRSALLRIPGVGPILADNITRGKYMAAAEDELRHVIDHRITVHFYLDASYPQRLRHYNQSPLLVYTKGTMDLNVSHALAIVGTRQPSTYGVQICEQLIRDLTPVDPLIVSGLAYGIDITAHRISTEFGLQTVGVLGSGMGQIYPQAHLKQARRMMSRGGVLTEFDFGMGPEKDNFPARNRIVAGMVDAVIVVETARTGGSMITVEFASSFHKDVMAVPGRVSDPLSAGCNALIREHKAHLIESADDVLSLLGWDNTNGQPAVQTELFTELDPREQLVVELVAKEPEIHIDTLNQLSKLKLSELATVLLSLEFKGFVRTMPGKRYRIR